ncbi:MAG: hypothetical protein VB092_03290 [Oscillospiraceae bacterium]|nr:hypothetical protein [Oscillospiraceae bacterium]
MIKAVGFVFILLSSCGLGYAKKAKLLYAEKLLEAFVSLCGELRYQMTFSSESLISILRNLSRRSCFSTLCFLSDALARYARTGMLNSALSQAFAAWENRALLSADEQSALGALFDSFACDGKDRETEKLLKTAESLNSALTLRRSDRRANRGYYELLYALVGAIVAIVLL